MRTTAELVWRLILCMVMLLLCSTKAQETQVFCLRPLAVGETLESCPSDAELRNSTMPTMPYSSCCTQPLRLSIYYRLPANGSNCTRCGPVMDEEATLPISNGDTTIILRWQLVADSIIPNDYIITHRAVSDIGALPQIVDGSTNSTQFINLDTGTQYIFRIFARRQLESEDLLSLPIQEEWFAGANSLPSFTNFTVVGFSSDEVNVAWALESPGVRPVQQVVVRWREGSDPVPPDEFPPNDNEIIFNEPSNPLTDGEFSFNLTGLISNQRYAILIQATSTAGTSNTYFAVQTDRIPIIIPPSQGPIGAAPNNIPSLPLVMLCSAVVLTKYFSHIVH